MTPYAASPSAGAMQASAASARTLGRAKARRPTTAISANAIQKTPHWERSNVWSQIVGTVRARRSGSIVNVSRLERVCAYPWSHVSGIPDAQ